MFTGLVQHVGKVVAVEQRSSGRSLMIDPAGWDHQPTSGASVSVNGCCLTLVEMLQEDSAPRWRFDVIPQTLRNTTLGDLQPGSRVNLERSLRAGDELGGHIVQGHIDGLGTVDAIDRDGGEWRVRIAAPTGLMMYLVPRGSVAVQGVSLTIADVDETSFVVALIPETLRATNLGELQHGENVNIETDCFARMVVHALQRMNIAGRDK